MKKAIFILALAASHKPIFCQTAVNNMAYQAVLIDFGADYTHSSVMSLSKWTHETRQLSPFQGISGHLSLSYLTGHFDYGVSIIFPNPNRIIDVYAGRRLTSLNSPFSSFINLELGSFNAVYSHLRPANSTSTTNQAGKIMQLQYNNAFVGLSTKNYFSHLNYKKNSFIIGGEFMAGYFPFSGDWQYGYHLYSGKSSSFISHRVHGIPYLGRVFFNAGITIGFAGKMRNNLP